MSFKANDFAERDRLIWQRIFERIERRGLSGMADFFHYKMVGLFGDGTFEATAFFKNFPTKITWVHDFVLQNGKYYKGYTLFAQAVYLQLQILMFITALANLISPRIRKHFKMGWIPLLSVFGITIFEYFIEINDSHMIVMLLMMVIASTTGMEKLKQCVERETTLQLPLP